MSYFTFFLKKIGQKTGKISEVSVFKNQYFLNKKYSSLEVLREDANDSLLPVSQIK
jgi:hypothetical protein